MCSFYKVLAPGLTLYSCCIACSIVALCNMFCRFFLIWLPLPSSLFTFCRLSTPKLTLFYKSTRKAVEVAKLRRLSGVEKNGVNGFETTATTSSQGSQMIKSSDKLLEKLTASLFITISSCQYSTTVCQQYLFSLHTPVPRYGVTIVTLP